MYRILGKVVLVTSALFLGATPAFAGSPDIYREVVDSSGPDDFWTERCGVPVTSAESSAVTVKTFDDGGYRFQLRATQTLQGPGGTVLRQRSYSWSSPVPVEVIGDPDSGDFTEIFRETVTGVRVVIAVGSGRLYQDVGQAYATVAIHYSDAGEDIVVADVVERGQHPTGVDVQALICDALD
jgi:hypothetical protein